MEHGTFVLALVTGAALLALWLNVRLPRLAPATLSATIAHALLGLLALQLVPGNAASAAWGLVVVLGLALPALVYVFLASVWFIRLAQGALAGSAR